MKKTIKRNIPAVFGVALFLLTFAFLIEAYSFSERAVAVSLSSSIHHEAWMWLSAIALFAIAVLFIRLAILRKRKVKEGMTKHRRNLEEIAFSRIRNMKDERNNSFKEEQLVGLEEMIATVTHEIRNPLSTVRTSIFSIDEAIKDNDHERFERALEMAERNIVRCDEVINELLFFTKKNPH